MVDSIICKSTIYFVCKWLTMDLVFSIDEELTPRCFFLFRTASFRWYVTLITSNSCANGKYVPSYVWIKGVPSAVGFPHCAGSGEGLFLSPKPYPHKCAEAGARTQNMLKQWRARMVTHYGAQHMGREWSWTSTRVLNLSIIWLQMFMDQLAEFNGQKVKKNNYQR